MDIHIVEHNENGLEVIIKCKQKNPETLRLKSHIALFDNKLTAKKDKELYVIHSSIYCLLTLPTASKKSISFIRGSPPPPVFF